jgi:FKBP-type peptidyl-prolyl cis-trans isomerase FkpA
MKRKLALFTCLALLMMSSCNKKLSPEEQMEKDQEIISNYISNNSLNAQSTSTGLHYVILDEGTGNHPNSTNDVTVRYKGYFADGSVFDQSDNAGVTFNLQQVIAGWTEGIPKLKEGGEGILLIPSALAYGPDGNSSIPPNSVIIFDVTLLDIPG